MGLVDGAPGVDLDHAAGFPFRDRQVSILYARKEAAAFLFEAILVVMTSLGTPGLISPTRSLYAARDVGFHEDRKVRLHPGTDDPVHFEHRFAAQLAPATLVGFGRVGKAIAENNFPVRNRGFDDFLDMLRARGKHQGKLCHRIKSSSGAVEQELADLFSSFGSTRFARDHHLAALLTQAARQFFELRAFATTVQSLKGDEESATPRRAHGKIIAEGNCGRRTRVN